MKNTRVKKSLTFGEFVARIYDTHTRRKAGATVQVAVNAHRVQFLGRCRFLIP